VQRAEARLKQLRSSYRDDEGLTSRDCETTLAAGDGRWSTGRLLGASLFRVSWIRSSLW